MPAKNKRASRVWERLIQSYGTRVAETYGAEMPKPWIDAIEDLTDQQIAYGIKAITRVTPAHPPTLGQFQECCRSMPVAKADSGPTIQEQLCAYATLQLFYRLKPIEFSRPWTYVYREWWDATRPKGFERCAECTGVVIDLDSGDRLGFSVANMHADTDGYAKALRSFRPGPKPSQAQVDAFRGKLPGLTS